jgi:arylsulfatase A-like enzyme
LHWAHYNGSFAVREGRWKLHSRKRDDLWLCDLHSDPGERTNLAEAEGPRVRRLATDHNRWLREVMDDAPEARERRGR